MIFDTDVLIRTLRGVERAASIIDKDPARSVSIVSCMELYHGARSKRDLAIIREFLFDFDIIPLSENIGHRARVYMEQFTLKTGLDPMDALIAASAGEHRLRLCTGSAKHYRQIPEIELTVFRP